MVAKKKTSTLSNAKKVIKTKAQETESKTVIETTTLTDEELFLGAKKETKEITVFDYLSPSVKYNVTVANGRVIKVNGCEVSTFLGLNEQARRALKQGEKVVTITDGNDKLLYKIEVL